MASSLSRTQIDKLGNRLRQGTHTDADLTLLDEYRLSFGPAYDHVVHTLRDTLKLQPTGRPAKSTSALAEKLVRESVRLVQIQDIAGCRVVVRGLSEQDRVVTAVLGKFPKATVIDRRAKPSFGYQAVHVVVEVDDKLVEIQVRTRLQHVWAELSEKMSDLYDPAIKYGGGENHFRELLAISSQLVKDLEEDEKKIGDLRAPLAVLVRRKSPRAKELQQLVRTLSRDMARRRTRFARHLEETISALIATQKGTKP